jgi:Mn-dependent DtxR family transcriptional regulator
MTAQKAHLSASLEDYLEAIYQLAGGSAGAEHEVRPVDLAAKLDVSKASVSKALAHLKDSGYVEQPHYGSITLTRAGRKLAAGVLERHHVLYHFLIDVLGVEPAIAADEACAMEHAISDDTLERWTRFLEASYK